MWSRLRAALAHAFTLPSAEELTPEQLARLDQLADAIRKRTMETPAMLAIESSRPLGGLAANAAYAIAPFLSLVVPEDEIAAAAKLMQHPAAVDALLDRLTNEPSSAGEDVSPDNAN